MKTRKILMITTIMWLVGFASACEDDYICKNSSNNTEWIQEIYPLAGTKWQVSKVIHTETGIERPIFVGDEVFTNFVPIMNFYSDTTGILIADTDWCCPHYNFNLSDSLTWLQASYTACTLPNNITMLIFAFGQKERWIETFNRYYGFIGYKLEGTQLKLYFHNDGFFYINNEDGKTIETMFSQRGVCTDSNWYNCVILEEMK